MTQKQICDKLGQDVTYISKIERGTRRLDLVELFELAQAMGNDPIEIAVRLKALLES